MQKGEHMVLLTGHPYHCTLKAKLPFPIGTVSAEGTLTRTGIDTVEVDVSAKGHDRHLSGKIENDTYSLETTVKGLPAGAVFTIDGKGKIDGTAYAWKFRNVSFSGSVEDR